MSKTNADYKREQRERAAKRGTSNLTLPVTPGVAEQIDTLCKRHGFEDWRELIFVIVRNLNDDTALSHKATEIPKCNFEPTKKQLRQLASYTAPDEDE